MITYVLVLVLLSQATAYFEVHSPSEVAGVYLSSHLKLNPVAFNISGELVVADPYDSCQPLKNNVTGKIVFVQTTTSCSPSVKTNHVQNAGGIAMLLVNSGIHNSHTGYLYYSYPDPGKTDIPALNIAYVDNLIAYMFSNHEPVYVSMSNTTYDPWAIQGQGPYGIAFQVFLEVFPAVCLGTALYKIINIIRKRGFEASPSQLCLYFEIGAAMIRIVYFIQPLQWTNKICGNVWNQWVEPTFVELAIPLSFMTTLLTTFYWQEVIRSVSKQLSAQVLTNLDKMKIPFVITIIILWTLQILSILGRTTAYSSGVNNVYTISAIVELCCEFCIGVFFIATGIRMLRISYGMQKAKYARLMKIVMACGICYMVGVISSVLYISPTNAINPQLMLAIYWLHWGALDAASLIKILGFEIPKERKDTSSSNTSLNRVKESNFTSDIAESKMDVETELEDSREHDFDEEDVE